MGIVITDTLTSGTGNTHPIVEDIEIKGGLSTVVLKADLDLISSDRRKEGMIVYVKEDSKYYTLNLDLITWDIKENMNQDLSLYAKKDVDEEIIGEWFFSGENTTFDGNITIQASELDLSGSSLKFSNNDNGNGSILGIETGEITNVNNFIASSGAILTLHSGHANNTDNPHNVTKTQVGLSNVNNTSDLNKPISTATQTALDDKLENSDIVDFETTSQLNTRDINNRNRSNHTGGQLASTIFDFESKVLEYEHTGFKKGGNVVANLVDDTTYFLNGTEPILTLPVINTKGERVQLINNSTNPTRVYPQTGDSIEGIIDGNYTVVDKGDVVVFYSDGVSNWYVKLIDKEIETGWAYYVDGEYTSASPYSISSTTTSPLLNNAATTINSQLPVGVTTLWDDTTNKLVSNNELDLYDIEIRFKAKTTSNNDSFSVTIDIGGTIGELSKEHKLFVKPANVEQPFVVKLTYFTGSTFLSNGGTINVTSGFGTLTIYDIAFLINRKYKGK